MNISLENVFEAKDISFERNARLFPSNFKKKDLLHSLSELDLIASVIPPPAITLIKIDLE